MFGLPLRGQQTQLPPSVPDEGAAITIFAEALQTEEGHTTGERELTEPPLPAPATRAEAHKKPELQPTLFGF
jgi:hypothetical protein